MAINKVNFSAGGEDLSDIYLSTEEAIERVDDGSISLTLLSDDGLTALAARSLFSWGPGTYGQLGLNATIARSSPVQVGALTDWKKINSQDIGCSFAVKIDGTLWAWGFGVGGDLGLNATINRSSPTQVGTVTDWKYLNYGPGQQASGRGVRPAIKTNGTLWVWGQCDFGSLGLSTTTFRSSPTQVGSLTNWKQISSSSLFTQSPFGQPPNFIRNVNGASLAVKTDGTLWAWGGNDFLTIVSNPVSTTFQPSGRLGLNDRSFRSSPIQVGSLTNWEQVFTSSRWAGAVKKDGTLWTWGSNGAGDLGLGNTISTSSPVQVGSLTNWKQIDNGLAVKTDGTLWAWGPNSLGGILGLNNTIAPSSPVQVGALTNWKLVSVSRARGAFGLKTDGTIWAWGAIGQNLGLNDTIFRSSPVQIGTLTGWRDIKPGLALR